MLYQKIQKTSALIVSISTLALASSGCQTQESPVRYQVTVPEINRIQLQVELTKRYGLGMSGSFDILNYGSIFLLPETPSTNFSFGFSLNTAAFLQSSWVNYQEVNTLPTGALFPSWMKTSVVDLKIPPIDTDPVEWDFYFGTRGQLYVGVAAGIKAINQNFPNLYIDYTFYDNQGRVVLGLVFYGPQKSDAGDLVKSGGIFVGSNITPFLPPEVLQYLSGQLPTHPDPTPISAPVLASSIESIRNSEVVRKVEPSALKSSAQPLFLTGVQMAKMAQKSSGSLNINGQSVTAQVKVRGKDAAKYQSPEATRNLINRFIAETN